MISFYVVMCFMLYIYVCVCVGAHARYMIDVCIAASLRPDVEEVLLIKFIFPPRNQPLTQTLVDQLLGL